MKGELLVKVFGFIVPEENLFLTGVDTAYFNGWCNKQMLVFKFSILIENSPSPASPPPPH